MTTYRTAPDAEHRLIDAINASLRHVQQHPAYDRGDAAIAFLCHLAGALEALHTPQARAFLKAAYFILPHIAPPEMPHQENDR